MTPRSLSSVGALVLLVLAAGCDKKPEIQVYQLVKAPPEFADGSATPAMTPQVQPNTGDEQTAEIIATPASRWEPQPPSAMRQASFLVKGDNGAIADISLVMLGGEAGGLLENANRWLSQLGQPAITAEKLAQNVQRLTTSIGDVTVVDLQGLPQGADPAKDGRIIVAIASSGDKTLFFKMRGNSELVGAEKDNFIKWVGSARSLEAKAGPTAVPATANAASDSDEPPVKWEVPDNWKVVPASSMRYASFAVSGENGEAGDISVIVFPGDGGGDLDNVNRWRQQIGLPPLDANQLNSSIVLVNGHDASISTVVMTGASAGIVAGWVRSGGRVWFFKLSGPTRLVTTEKANFVKFLESVQFHS
jgi:hypothetical protein